MRDVRNFGLGDTLRCTDSWGRDVRLCHDRTKSCSAHSERERETTTAAGHDRRRSLNNVVSTADKLGSAASVRRSKGGCCVSTPATERAVGGMESHRHMTRQSICKSGFENIGLEWCSSRDGGVAQTAHLESRCLEVVNGGLWSMVSVWGTCGP